MTISSLTSKVIYVGTGSTAAAAKVFAYPFTIFADADLTVSEYVVATSVATVKTLNSDYNVSGAGVSGGGNVTLTGSYTNLPTGSNLVIQRLMPITQGTDYVENDAFPAETHEKTVDKLCMITQQLQEQIDRSIKADIAQGSSNVIYTDFVNQSIAVASSATVAVVQASAAGVSATNASTSETNAGNSATAAASSATVCVTITGVSTSSATVSISAANSSIGRDTTATSSATVSISAANSSIGRDTAAASSATVAVASQVAAASSGAVAIVYSNSAAASATAAASSAAVLVDQPAQAASSATVAITYATIATSSATVSISASNASIGRDTAAASSATVAITYATIATSSGAVAIVYSNSAAASAVLASQSAATASTGAVGLQDEFNAGQDILIDDNANQTLELIQNDVTNNPNAFNILNSGAGNALFINQDGATGSETAGINVQSSAALIGNLVRVIASGATNSSNVLNVVSSGVGNGIALTVGGTCATARHGFHVYCTTAQTSSDAALVKFNQAATASTEPVLEISNAGSGAGIEIATSGQGISLTANSAIANGAGVVVANALTGTDVHGLYVIGSGATSQGNCALAKIAQNNAASTEPALEIHNDGTGAGVEINQTNNGRPLVITNNGTNLGLYVNQVGVSAAGSPSVYVYSNAANVNADSALVKILQDNAASTEPALEIKNDGTGAGLEMSGAGSSAHVRLTKKGANSSPIDGDMWYQGTNLYIRLGGTTCTVNVTSA